MLFQLDGVTKTYGPVTALNDLSVTVPAGAVGLLGPNGSGKTTMIRTLLGLIPVDRGSGTVLGLDFRTRQLDIRRLVGVAPEDECLFPGVAGVEFAADAGELVGMRTKDAMQRAHEVLDYVGLGEARYRRVETYSTGMKQRLKLAQALVHDPPVLLLDEPTSGLDPAGRDAMLRLLLELGRDFGKSLILSTHLLADVAAVCEQVVILMNGEVRGQGSVAELCARRANHFVVRVQGEPEAFRVALEKSAVRVLSYNAKGEFRVQVPDGWQPRDFFRLAGECGVVVRAILPDDETLEEMFLRTAGSG
jgi:ABC-2 type transport system ATP-binding protein